MNQLFEINLTVSKNTTIMKKISLLVLFFPLLSQEYIWPTNTGKHLSSNFGEFRTTGYHLGVDMKTKGTEGHPIYAVSDGYVSRVVTNYSGFGKALYLTMEDGKTAVYAHLSKLSDELEERLKEEQEKSQSYLTNFYLTPNEFPFMQNDIIAYSGNSGFSFGPHLHFEIRDEKGMILNPLTNGLNQPDRLAPIVEEISLAPLNKESWINGNQLPQNFPVFRDKKGEYHFADTINTYGKIGLAVKTYDKREGAKNKYQPHRIEVFLNGQLYHSLEFEKLNYNWQSTANYINDYRNSRLNMGDFVKLYRNYNDPLIPVHSSDSDGTFELNKGYHDIKILIYDAQKNVRTVNGTLFVMNPYEIDVTNLGEANNIVSFLLSPKSIAIPIKSAIIYSFTPFGYADERIDVISQERVEAGLIITLPKNKIKRKALQFITQNDIGTISMPAHWNDKKISGDHLTLNVDLDISHSDAGVYIQIQPEKVIDQNLSLRLKGEFQYITKPINQIQPSVYLSAPLLPEEFENINQIEAIIGGTIERQIQFKFPFTIIYPESSITIVSKDGSCSVKTRKNTFTESTLGWIEPVHKYPKITGGMLLTRVYQLQPFQKPMLKPINIAMRYPRKIDNRKKHLYFYDKKEGWTFIKTQDIKERRVLLGEIKHLDAIAVIEDKTPPKMIRSHPGNNGKYGALELNQFKINIDDKLSGFDPSPNSFEVKLDDKNIFYAFQPKVKVLSYDLDEPLSVGKHKITFKATDQAGNTLEKNIQFEVY
tara:strand:- start:9825 stop:12113 length:2289 start_codon:yes stop_codon:yes gene_type:complete